MYNRQSNQATEFISHEEILETMALAKEQAKDLNYVNQILRRAKEVKGLSHRDAAVLFACGDKECLETMYAIAMDIKREIYGNRIVMFAPLYLSNYCVNGCRYCSYHHDNVCMQRKKLSSEEIKEEVAALCDMGHKRLALEAGEDDENCPIDYILQSLKDVYSVKHKNGEIRRANVNIAATTVENYRKLKAAGIGTYILFQETYHKEAYEYYHPKGPKHHYAYHTEAMDRAMEGGIDDVGIGALLGLYDAFYDLVGLLLHAEHLEAAFGVGPHTVSVPRIRPADDVDINSTLKPVDDETFRKIVAILRITMPYTGLIISTRETKASREAVLKVGVSQISGGSRTTVGGYCKGEQEETAQFEVNDERPLLEIMDWLISMGYTPSFCTACYRAGRVGDRFMPLAKSGQIKNVCAPNSLVTLKEYLVDYGDEALREKGDAMIAREVEKIPNETVREKVKGMLIDIAENNKRDFRF